MLYQKLTAFLLCACISIIVVPSAFAQKSLNLEDVQEYQLVIPKWQAAKDFFTKETISIQKCKHAEPQTIFEDNQSHCLITLFTCDFDEADFEKLKYSKNEKTFYFYDDRFNIIKTLENIQFDDVHYNRMFAYFHVSDTLYIFTMISDKSKAKEHKKTFDSVINDLVFSKTKS